MKAGCIKCYPVEMNEKICVIFGFLAKNRNSGKLNYYDIFFFDLNLETISLGIRFDSSN